MSRFKKKKDTGPQAINTSSLPDIIFMLLFFFMVTTVMREITPLVKTKLPTATEVQKLGNKGAISYVYVGPPQGGSVKDANTDTRIQLNDKYATVDDIKEFIIKEKEEMNEEDKAHQTTALKVHHETRMGVVTDIKQELRNIGAFKITYATLKKSRDNKK